MSSLSPVVQRRTASPIPVSQINGVTMPSNEISLST
jgi:hypothetical protein